MNNDNHKTIGSILVSIFLLVWGLSSCTGEPGSSPRAWIDVPVDGLTLPVGQPVNIEGHVGSTSGVSRVEIWVDGGLQFTIESPPFEDGLARFSQSWTPPGIGEYTIQTLAYGPDGEASAPDSARVHVEATTNETLTLTPTEVPEEPSNLPPSPVPLTDLPDTPTFTPTPTVTACVPSAVFIQNANCRHGPGTVYDILTSLLEGQNVLVEGRNQDSSWWWVLLPESSAHCWVSAVTVDAVCIPPDLQVLAAPPTPTFTPTPYLPSITPTNTSTPTTAPDTTPPPIPGPAVPADGLALTCRASQTLAWLPVDDPSGIVGYYVKLEMEVKPGEWQSAGGYGPVLDKQVNVDVDCGVRYRWMVRAEDGAGNVSAWSAPSYFSITLD